MGDRMEIFCKRRPTVKDTTFGELSINGAPRFCWTLEDRIRELPGRPVYQWKVPGKTAIPAGRYKVGLVNSPKFGPDTITLLDVPGFEHIRVHAGNDDEHTEGCPLVGFDIVEDPAGDGGNIKGGTSGPALTALKQLVVPAINMGEDVWWNVSNP